VFYAIVGSIPTPNLISEIDDSFQKYVRIMDSKEFKTFRKRLNKTQMQMAQLLGTSIKTIHSYEQGWRGIPAHAERQMFFLLYSASNNKKGQKSCWILKQCPTDRKKQCPAWEYRLGKLCWFINGTICDGNVYRDWKKKMKLCRSCEVFVSMMQTNNKLNTK
jgi:DNA-binding transcriptional regulator YiaG